MKKLKYLFLFLSSLGVYSCAHNIEKDHESSLYSVTVGSLLHLNQSIIIQAGLARTFFQNGQITDRKDIDIYKPHCSITVNDITLNQQTINPTTFVIYKITDDEEYATREILYASANLRAIGDGPTIMANSTYYFLKSADAPHVRTLECLLWDDPYNAEYLSINEIKSSLGNIFTLTVND